MDANNSEKSQLITKKGGKSTLVLILAILSFISSGFFLFLFLWGTFYFEPFLESFEPFFTENIPESILLGLNSDYYESIKIILYVLILINAGTIIGPVLMLKKKKIGFFIYAASNIVWVLLFFIGLNIYGIAIGFISLLFIFGYFTKYKGFN